jgi:P-type conjugative transfer protein TrbJ
MKRKLATILLATALATTAAAPAEAQFGFGSSIVFDPTNYSQNVLTAARELQQVTNQIQQLQNEAMMLQNMATNLSSLNFNSLSSMISALTQISNLMNQASGIAFNVSATNAAFNQTYPQTYPTTTSASTLTANAQQRWQDAMSAFQQTLQVQAQVAQNVQADTTTLSNLVSASQGAAGNLQVNQAGNQLLALSTKQQLQVQNLMAAQYRAEALDRARSAQDEAAGQAEFSTFLGNASAYTPN